MNDATVVVMTVVGLGAGALLDPVGQRMSNHSVRREAQRQRDRASATRALAGRSTGGREPSITSGSRPDPQPVPALVQPGQGDLRHLVASGPSPGRTSAASIVTGGLFASLAFHFGPHLVLAPLAVFFAMLVAVSVTDLSFRLVPRWLVYGSVLLVVPLLAATAGTDHQWRQFGDAAIGGLAAFGVFFAIWWFVPHGLGYGDVRLAGVIGLATGYLGLLHAYLSFLIGFALAAVFGLVVMVVMASGRKTRIPFAPALAVGAVLAVLFGGHLGSALFGTGS